MKYTSRAEATPALSAKSMGSGALEVLATPAMVALMENAAMNAIQAALPEGYGSVGTHININHTRATSIGNTIEATAEVTKINGREITFILTASDPYGDIGVGEHTRFVIENSRFLEKLKK